MNSNEFYTVNSRCSACQRIPLFLWLGLAGTILVVVGVLLRWSLTTGLQCDELLLLRAIELGPLGGLLAEGSSHPPLFRWIVGALLSAQSPDWLLRTPSIIASVFTIVVWFFIFRRVVEDDWVIFFLIPLVACGSGWLEIGYQLTPYAFLTLICSLHGLFWLRLLDEQSLKNIVWFVITGVAPIWTHFYGANVIVADQIIWLFLIWKYRELWRIWLGISIATVLLALPVVPIALFYVQLEKPFALVRIDNYPSYFVERSFQLFSKMTFNIGILGPLIGVWYLVVGHTFLQWLRKDDASKIEASPAEQQLRQRNFLILCGFFLAGLPAAQAHSVLTEKAMWARYAVLATWVHWPLLVVVLQTLVSKKTTRVATAVFLGWCLFAFFSINQMRQAWTFDHSPAIKMLSEHGQAADAYFAQDMDFWVGDANFDRLWFQRYSPVKMPIVTNKAMGRFELASQGLSFSSVPSEIQRIWVCSDLYNAVSLRKMQTSDWRIIKLDDSVPMRPVALFARNDSEELQAKTVMP